MLISNKIHYFRNFDKQIYQYEQQFSISCAWGLGSLECTREEYKGNTII